MHSTLPGLAMMSRTAAVLAACLLYMVLPLQASPALGETDSCTFQFLSFRALEVVCEGTHHFRRSYRLSKSKKAIDVMPGVQLLADPIVSGERALIAISNRSIELHNLQFNSPYAMERLRIAVPVAIVDAEVVIKDSMFSSSSSSSVVGGLHLSNSSVSVIDSSFFACGFVDERISVGAILASHHASLRVSRSQFFDIESDRGAIFSENSSKILIEDSTFARTNGVKGAALAVVSGGKAKLHRTKIQACLSLEQGTIVMTGAKKLEISSSTIMSNRGLNGGAVAVSDVSSGLKRENRRRNETLIVIADSYIGGNIAEQSGGGLYLGNARLFMNNTEVILNHAKDQGAGLFIHRSKEATIQFSRFMENRFKHESIGNGQQGGGIFATEISSFNLIGSQLMKNKAPQEGGGSYFSGIKRLKVSDSLISKNFAKYGAGIAASESKVEISDSNFTQNEARVSAAGLLLRESDIITVKRTLLSHNTAASEGAAWAFANAHVRFQQCTFHANDASGHGSGLTVEAVKTAEILETKFLKNTVTYQGAAMNAAYVGTLTVKKSVFLKNKGANGAACSIRQTGLMHIHKSEFKLNRAMEGIGASVSLKEVNDTVVSDSNFGMNLATDSGGAIFARSSRNLTCIRSVFFKNRAQESGGGILVQDSSHVYIKDSRFRNNSALFEGGAVFVDNVHDLKISDSTFKSNNAANSTSSQGGALTIFAISDLTMRNCDFFHNRAGSNGGAVSLPKAPNSAHRTIDISHSKFHHNVARKGFGGALFLESAKVLKIANTPFDSNRAHRKGSAFFSRSADRVKVSGSRFPGNELEIESDDDPPSHEEEHTPRISSTPVT